MEIKEMSIEELEERLAAIPEALEAEGADLDALEAEVRDIKAELEARKAAEKQKVEIRAAVASGKGEVIAEVKEEKAKTMTNEEIRNSKEYINAYAEYIKNNDDAECRALLTENVSGSVPVPELVYGIVKTAWERDGIMERVAKAYVKGNYKVSFEISGTDAVAHTEGGDPVSEETLVLGTVTLIPQSIKKWISISDEVYDMRGEEFLRYIYDELTYRIAKKSSEQLIADIKACGTVSTTTAPGVPVVTASSISIGTIASAMAELSDEADNPVIIMNKKTWGAFKQTQYGNSIPVDPFEGLPVIFNNSMTAYSAATTGVPYVIVGDLEHGALANLPNGEGIDIKYDNTTLMTNDLIRVLGRQYVAAKVIAPNAFVKIVK